MRIDFMSVLRFDAKNDLNGMKRVTTVERPNKLAVRSDAKLSRIFELLTG